MATEFSQETPVIDLEAEDTPKNEEEAGVPPPTEVAKKEETSTAVTEPSETPIYLPLKNRISPENRHPQLLHSMFPGVPTCLFSAFLDNKCSDQMPFYVGRSMSTGTTVYVMDQLTTRALSCTHVMKMTDDELICAIPTKVCEKECLACNRQITGATFKVCSGCNFAAYCNDTCANVGWQQGHHITCKIFNEAIEEQKNHLCDILKGKHPGVSAVTSSPPPQPLPEPVAV